MKRIDDGAIILRAHAKLTRSLRMTGIRSDGYHLIEAEMVSLDLHDLVVVRPGDAGIAVTGSFGDGVPTDDTNLVVRALRLVGKRASVTIDKRIPHGGGLGGGSTDAAAVLRWAGMSTDPRSLARAAGLGADIAFCMVGGRAAVSGIGEVVDPLPHVDREITLVIPPLAISTPDAFRAWDDLAGPRSDGPNDLEPAALVVEPRMAWWRDAIAERIGEPPVLAGSGATWFTERVFRGRERDDALGDLVGEGARVVATRTTEDPFDSGTGVT